MGIPYAIIIGQSELDAVNFVAIAVNCFTCNSVNSSASGLICTLHKLFFRTLRSLYSFVLKGVVKLREIATRAEREVSMDTIIPELLKMRGTAAMTSTTAATTSTTVAATAAKRTIADANDDAPPPKGTMYTYPQSFRAYKGLIAAQYSGLRRSMEI